MSLRRRDRRVPAMGVALAVLAFAAGCSGKTADPTANPTQNVSATTVDLTISTNAIAGGKSAAEAEWISSYVIPTFVAEQKAKGVTAAVKFVGSGVDDEQYKSKMALDLRSKSGSDVIALDGIWVGEFAEAGYIQPLEKVVGAQTASWDGWAQIAKAVQNNVSYQSKPYGVPAGTDGRVLYFNKKLFAQAGLPAGWQPTSWDDILTAAQSLKKLNGVIPVQIDAGSAMGEATAMQGVLPLLVGTGVEIYQDGKWQGNTAQIREVLAFYKKLFDTALADRNLQLPPRAGMSRSPTSRPARSGSWLKVTTSGGRSSNPPRATRRWSAATATSASRSSRRWPRVRGSAARTSSRCPAVVATSSIPTRNTHSRPGSCSPS